MDACFGIEKLRSLPESCIVHDYLNAFIGRESEPFLTFYDVEHKKEIITRTYTRGSFLSLSLKALRLISSVGLSFGERHAHYFSGNSVEDLALRTAAVLPKSCIIFMHECLSY